MDSQHAAAGEQVFGYLARPGPWLLVCVVLAGCQRDGTTPSSTATSVGNGTTTGGEASTTFEDPDACVSSQDCETEGNCVAPYDPMPPDAQVDRGPASCAEVCIDDNALSKWCIDNASCCGVLRCNPVDGFCEPAGPPPGGETGSATGTGTDSGGTTTGDTTTGGSGTSGSGTSTSDASSSTGASTSGTSSGSESSSGGDTGSG